MVRCGFCSIGEDGEKCAEVVEKNAGAVVRGSNFKTEKASGKCVVCNKKANNVVYIARDY